MSSRSCCRASTYRCSATSARLRGRQRLPGQRKVASRRSSAAINARVLSTSKPPRAAARPPPACAGGDQLPVARHDPRHHRRGDVSQLQDRAVALQAGGASPPLCRARASAGKPAAAESTTWRAARMTASRPAGADRRSRSSIRRCAAASNTRRRSVTRRSARGCSRSARRTGIQTPLVERLSRP